MKAGLAVVTVHRVGARIACARVFNQLELRDLALYTQARFPWDSDARWRNVVALLVYTWSPICMWSNDLRPQLQSAYGHAGERCVTVGRSSSSAPHHAISLSQLRGTRLVCSEIAFVRRWHVHGVQRDRFYTMRMACNEIAFTIHTWPAHACAARSLVWCM